MVRCLSKKAILQCLLLVNRSQVLALIIICAFQNYIAKGAWLIPFIPRLFHHFLGADKYYSGGYITRSYGSLDVGIGEDSAALFDAIQLETPRESRIEGGEEERINYGKALSRVIVMFYRKYYYNELVQSLKMLG